MLRFQKRVLILLTLIIIFSAFTPANYSFAQVNYSVAINGALIKWEDAIPYMTQGRLMVPIAKFGEALGAEIKWDAHKQEAFIFWRGRYAWMQVSNYSLYYGSYNFGNQLTDVSTDELPVRPRLRLGRLFVPLASLVDAFNGTLFWDNNAQTAHITIPYPVQRFFETEEPSDDTQPQEEVSEYFLPLSLEEVITRYKNDDPFVLVQYDSSLSPAALDDMMMVAEDLKIKIYGLDITKENADLHLPFSASGGHEVYVYFINGYGRVDVLGDPGYNWAADSLRAYMETE